MNHFCHTDDEQLTETCVILWSSSSFWAPYARNCSKRWRTHGASPQWFPRTPVVICRAVSITHRDTKVAPAHTFACPHLPSLPPLSVLSSLCALLFFVLFFMHGWICHKCGPTPSPFVEDFFFFFYRGLSEWESKGEERESLREGGSEEPGSGAASPAGLTAQILTTAFTGADAAAPGQAQTVAGVGGSWTGSPPLLLEAQLRLRVWWRRRSQSLIHSPPAWSQEGCTLRWMETCQDTPPWERGCWTWWGVLRGSLLCCGILLSTVKATSVGKNRYARGRKSVLLQETCWQCVFPSQQLLLSHWCF